MFIFSFSSFFFEDLKFFLKKILTRTRSRSPLLSSPLLSFRFSLSLSFSLSRYRAQDVRNNLCYAKDGTIVYTAAALGVCFNPEISKEQRFMSGHTDDVLSMAVWDNPNKVGSIVATGERGAAPRIIIWSTDDVKILNTLRATHQRGVCQLAFSNDGVRNIF